MKICQTDEERLIESVTNLLKINANVTIQWSTRPNSAYNFCIRTFSCGKGCLRVKIEPSSPTMQQYPKRLTLGRSTRLLSASELTKLGPRIKKVAETNAARTSASLAGIAKLQKESARQIAAVWRQPVW